VAQIDLTKVLDKAWVDKDLPEILAAPVSALAGVSDRAGELLYEALGVKTIADLANMKYARWAQALAALNTP
jgi:nucleotidyltransferase/DNA polymerase involved in DNA repair